MKDKTQISVGSFRSIWQMFLGRLLFCFAGFSTVSGATTVDQLVREAYERSPELKAAYAKWEAALEGVPQARSLPDPVVSYGYFIERMDTRQIFRVEQMFPGFGKRGLKAGVSEEVARVAADELEVVAADIRLQVLEAVANRVLVAQSALLVEENLALVEQLEQVALQRYRAGESSQADVLRLQMEKETLKADVQSWKERVPVVLANLNAIIGRDADYPVEEITELPVTEDRTGIFSVSEQLLAGNPELRQGQSLIRQAERARELAQRESRPDIMLGVEFMDNRGAMARDEVLGMVSISIPLWRGRYSAMKREATAGLRAAEQDYKARFHRLQADAQMAFYEKQDAARRVRLYEESLIPRARQTLAVLESEYKTGGSGFLDLLEAQRSLLDLQLLQVQARVDYFNSVAGWERIVGPFEEVGVE